MPISSPQMTRMLGFLPPPDDFGGDFAGDFAGDLAMCFPLPVAMCRLVLPRDRPHPMAVRPGLNALVDGKGRGCQLLQVEILALLDGHADAENPAALEFARRLIVFAHSIAAVATDAEPVAG